MVVAVGVYALIWYLLYWYTGDLNLSILVTALIAIADLIVLIYIFRDELSGRLRLKK